MKEFSSWWVYKTFQTGALYGIVRFADWEEWLIKLGGVFRIGVSGKIILIQKLVHGKPR